MLPVRPSSLHCTMNREPLTHWRTAGPVNRRLPSCQRTNPSAVPRGVGAVDRVVDNELESAEKPSKYLVRNNEPSSRRTLTRPWTSKIWCRGYRIRFALASRPSTFPLPIRSARATLTNDHPRLAQNFSFANGVPNRDRAGWEESEHSERFLNLLSAAGPGDSPLQPTTLDD